MKSNKYIDWLDFGIFEGTVMFMVGFDNKEALSILKKKKYGDWLLAFEQISENNWDKNCFGFVQKIIEEGIENRRYYFLVLKNVFDFKDSSHAILAHEVLHLCSFHLKDKLDVMVENECFCYTHTHIMNQCYKILRS